ncbi:MAG: hypothetical protein O3B31_09645 [Chloroflexi bacterium]|nr:hypothetical protein [Chloroflexota bacterium]
MPWTALAVAGAALAVLYAVALDRRRRARRGVQALIVAIALADIVGEFVAQGTIAITGNVSFVVALALLVLVTAERRRGRRGRLGT